MRQRSQFNGPRLTDKLEALLRTRPETPFLAIDGDVVLSKYLTMRVLSEATIYYAGKANQVPGAGHEKDNCHVTHRSSSRQVS